MRVEGIQIAEESADLMELPVGTKILTNQHRVLQLDLIETPTNREDAGTRYWIEPGTLQPFPPDGLDHWYPALILPSQKD